MNVTGPVIAAIYARRSTDQTGIADEQKSVARQVDHARGYAATKGWTVKDAHVYGAPFDWDVNPCLYYSSGVSKPLTSWNDFVVNAPSRSVTLTTKRYVPAAVGLPISTPFAPSRTPGGS